jgi:dipeptidyl aminopeptidase/acylaminoacyl peptidase
MSANRSSCKLPLLILSLAFMAMSTNLKAEKSSGTHQSGQLFLAETHFLLNSGTEFSDQLPLNVVDDPKKDLTPEEYAQWQRIGTTALSPDANWFAWTIHLVEGDGWMMLQQTGEDPDEGLKFEHAMRPSFSSDNRWFAFQIGVSEKERRRLSDQNERVKNKLAIKDLASSEIDTFQNISTFEFSEDGRFLLMRKYQPQGSDIRGYDLILRNLHEGTNQLIGNVAEYGFNEEGTLLAYLIDSHDQLGNGVHLIDLTIMTTRVLESDEAKYERLTWNEEGSGLAFFKTFESDEFEEKNFNIFVFDQLDATPQKKVFNPAEHPDFPAEHRVVNYRNLRWSDDGRRVFFGIKEWTKKDEEVEEAAEPDVEEPDNEQEEERDDPDAHLDPTNVEIWHWRDDLIQSRQRVLQQQLEQANLLSVWHLEDDRFVKLTDNYDHTLSLTGDQMHAILLDAEPHKPRLREQWNDIYLVDVTNGSRRPILERHEWVFSSAAGNYLIYFRDNHWWSYDIEADRHINLTEEAEHPFNNIHSVTGREFDPAFGRGLWEENDEWVLLFDEFDVYKASPDGRSLERITHGRDDEIRYRQHRFDFQTDAIDPEEPFYLNMFGERTKERGFARVNPGEETETLIYEQANISGLLKADNAPNYAYVRQTAVDSPNYFLTNREFGSAVQLTNTNPQQDEYYWADDELISFTNQRGEELEGRLLYPANYNPDEQYPMIVLIYERLSQSLHNYDLPSRTSAYNQRRFSSEGYFVFMPDITYEIKRPGMSAVESVVPAVEAVLETGMIDPERIGLTGHSWGGYQTNFIITQSDLFSSAVAGAPLVNLISMYNSIYWSSGFHQGYIFETSQGRFPFPWWEDEKNFIENSPLHQIENSDTPLLLMFGTEDGAVPFNQGVELYTTMRRMHKEFVMLVYEGEGHGLGRRENQIDYANRAMEWHAYYLLGEEPAPWILEGIPFIERPELQGR